MSAKPRLTFLVADDHPLFRAAVIQVLREAIVDLDIVEAASASSLEAGLEEGRQFDLVLLDLMMPGAKGFSALLALRGKCPDVPVVVISSNDHAQVVQRARQFGAAAFIPKASPPALIHTAITEVLEGGSWFPPVSVALSKEDEELAGRLAQLTPQQFKVLLCLADGLLNKQIAHELDLAENTVKVHITAILKKLNCYSRTQAAVLVKSLEPESREFTGQR
ncbi:MAG: response regulator transcription factor [Comamonas sp.]